MFSHLLQFQLFCQMLQRVSSNHRGNEIESFLKKKKKKPWATFEDTTEQAPTAKETIRRRFSDHYKRHVLCLSGITLIQLNQSPKWGQPSRLLGYSAWRQFINPQALRECNSGRRGFSQRTGEFLLGDSIERQNFHPFFLLSLSWTNDLDTLELRA